MDGIFNVTGINGLDGTVFARCTTMEKASKAKEMLEANGFFGMVDIIQDKTPMDVVQIDGKTISL